MGNLFEVVKRRLGIAEAITVYDKDIQMYIDECKQDMVASEVPKAVVDAETPAVATAVYLYVDAHLWEDKTNREEDMALYCKKVSRMTLEPDGSEENVE